jgi:H+/Cl- antiporter ClcA
MRLRYYFRSKYLKFNLEFAMLAILIGLISVFFVKVVELAFNGFLHLEAILGWWLIAYVPLMMIFIVFLLKKYFPEAEGSGLPQVIAIGQMDDSSIQYYFKIKAIFSKILLITLGTLSGGTLGREGATVQIGASLMNQLGRNLSLQRRKTMLIVGAASGLASAFNTPLGGIVFALEELIKTSRLKFSLFKMTGIAISGVVSISILSNYSYFGRVERNLMFYDDKIFIAAIVIGLVAGLISVGFARVVRFFMLDKSPLVSWRKNNPYKNALYCGVIVAVVGLLSHGLSFGNGYHESRMALNNEIELPVSYVFYKLISALFTTNSGIPGGYFATSLAIGNGIGGLVHDFFVVGNLQQYYLLGMVAFLAALTRAPATAIVMVLQVSATQVFTLPLIVAALSATLLANACGKGIYEYQIEKLK